MEAAARQFLTRLLETPSPSGYEEPVQRVVRDYAQPFADEIRTDLHGNQILVKNPGAPIRVMLAGHCDQIGFLIHHIDDEGFLYFQAIGGWDGAVVVGQPLTVWTADGPVQGVCARKAIHLLKEGDREKAPKLEDLWIDIGAANREEALARVQIGDPVTVRLGASELTDDLVFSPGMDDKTGLWTVVEALRRIDGKKLNCSVYAVSTVQEEIGLRGARTSATAIEPHVGIAVDVTHATDCPGIDKKRDGDVRLGAGPVVYRGPNMNPKVAAGLFFAAEQRKIAIQRAAEGRATGTDANAIQTAGPGVAAGLVSVPNRYMHSPVEVVSLADLDAIADLLAGFCEDVQAGDRFEPGLSD